MEAEDTVDETNDDDSDYEIDDNDEDDDASSVGSTESLVPLQDVIDTVTGQRETEDSDFHLGELFNVNIGDGGFVEIIELKDMGEERSLHLWGFSHRWTKIDPSDRRRTIILLRDAIDWLVLNVFLRICHYYLTNHVAMSVLTVVWITTTKKRFNDCGSLQTTSLFVVFSTESSGVFLGATSNHLIC